MKIRMWADFGAGLLFFVIGCAAIFIAQDYPFGTASRMGPGYVPIWLASALALIGTVLVVRSMIPTFVAREETEADNGATPIFAFRAVFGVLGAVLIFALTIDHVGLAVASIILVVISGTSVRDYNVREVVITAICLSVLCVGLFVYGLGVPVAAFPFRF